MSNEVVILTRLNMSNERPDKRLRNWEKWMNERRDVHRKLADGTGRSPGFLLMNAGENAQIVGQKKAVVEGLEVPFEHDRYRGNPAFWTLPPALNKVCEEPQTYYATRTRRERCLKPELEYVQVPKGVAVEKQSQSKRMIDLRRSRYFEERYGCRKAKLIEPHEPELDDMMLKGNRANLAVESSSLSGSRDQDSTVVPSEQSSQVSSDLDATTPVHLMSLNELDLHDDAVGVKKLAIFADTDSPSDVSALRLRLVNHTSRAVHLGIARRAPSKIFRDYLPPASNAQHFYYDRTEQIVLPAARLDVPFWFRSGSYGCFTEHLELTFRPDRWGGRLRVELELYATAIPRELDERCDRVLRSIDNSTKLAMAADLLGEVVERAEGRSTDFGAVRVYSYDRALLFEAVNAAYDPFQIRPKYTYDRKVVDELERLYEEARLERHPEVWDYRLENLKTVCVDRDNFDRIAVLKEQLENWRCKVEESKAERKRLDAELEENLQILVSKGRKTSHDDKKHKSTPSDHEKPEKKKHSIDEQSTKRNRPRKSTSVEEKVVWRRRYDELVAKLETPVAWKLVRRERLRVCYALLCAHVDRIFAELDDGAELEWSIPKYPLTSSSSSLSVERIYDERLEHCSAAHPCLVEATEGLPAPQWSESVPMEDYRKRCSLAGKHGPPSNTKVVKAARISRGELSTLMGSAEKIRRGPAPLQNDGAYPIVYAMLQQFVDELTAVFELLSEPDLSLAEVSQMHRAADPLQPVHDFQVEIFDLKRTISEVLKGDEGVNLECRSVFVRPHRVKVEDSCESIVSLLRPYYPKTMRTRPRSEGEVYLIEPHVSRHEMVDNVTVMTAEEVVVERAVQTSICGSDAVAFEDRVETTDGVCVCEEVEVVKEPEFDYYDSRTGLHWETPESSDEVDSCSLKP